MNSVRLILFIILSFSNCAQNARILASIFSPSFSHQVAFRPLWKELARRGHEITLLTTDPMQESLSNIKQIDLSGSYQVMEGGGSSKLTSAERSSAIDTIQRAFGILYLLDLTAEWQLSQPEVRNLIRNKSESFDLLIVEVMNPINMAFADRFNIPFIGISPMDTPYRIHAAIGNYMHPILYPDFFLAFPHAMTFSQRFVGFIYSWLNWYFQYHMQYPAETEIARKHFGSDIRDLSEIEKDMSFLFVNTNPIIHRIRPSGINTIYIGGGLHLDKTKYLPKDLQNFMDNATEGVIYVSLGTNVKSALISDDLKAIILTTFADLPYKILWKFEGGDLKNISRNINLAKWVPQQELLGHRNLKLFITQCGLQSIEEAIFSHVPMIGMPFMWDQPNNARFLETNGLGLFVEATDLTKEKFTNAITEVIRNISYKENVVKISKLLEDVEMTGLEKAVFWTEYCLRTGGAKHLKSPVNDMPTYQFYLLDVIGAVLSIVITFSTVSFLVLYKFYFFVGTCMKRRKNKFD